MDTFISRVYTVVSQIPRGQVMTYKQVATKAGNPKAARAVGMAMRNNTDLSRVPCHRVIGSDGKMHGYAYGGEAKKIELLKEEGVRFLGNRVQRLD